MCSPRRMIVFLGIATCFLAWSTSPAFAGAGRDVDAISGIFRHQRKNVPAGTFFGARGNDLVLGICKVDGIVGADLNAKTALMHLAMMAAAQ